MAVNRGRKNSKSKNFFKNHKKFIFNSTEKNQIPLCSEWKVASFKHNFKSVHSNLKITLEYLLGYMVYTPRDLAQKKI